MTSRDHERLKRRLDSARGMLFLSQEEGVHLASGRILHSSSRAARNFQSTLARLRGSRICSAISSPVLLLRNRGPQAPDLRSLEFQQDGELPEVLGGQDGEVPQSSAGIPAGEHKAAARIQAVYKASRARRLAAARRASVIKAQAAYRTWSARRNFRRMQAAVEVIQRSYRARKSRLKEIRAAAIVIQAHARGFLVRSSIRRCESAAILIQQSFWKLQVRRVSHAARNRYLLTRKSARKIQAAYRTWRLISTRKNRAAIVLQRFIRRRKQGTLLQSVESVEREDWNTVEIEHLEQCLDTCLAVLHPQLPQVPLEQKFPVDLPISAHSHHKDQQTSGYNQSLREKKLQQVARVFLLQHHIALQQQRAKNAPPFPPSREATLDSRNQHYSTLLNTGKLSGKTSTASTDSHTTGDVVLDVQYLLEEARKLSASSSPVLFTHNDDLESGATKQDLKQMNALLVVFVAVVIMRKASSSFQP